jgi:DNA-binding transcriptional regulator LsrR (DeoR family)
MKKKETEIDIVAAAYLAGEGKLQKEIADQLNLSQTLVSRMLAKAKNLYWREEVTFLRDKIDAQTSRELLDRIGRNDLARRLSELSQRHASRPGPVLRVFGGEKGANDKARSFQFAREAAPYVKGLLERAGTCGVTWGGMLGHVLEALRTLAIPAPWKQPNLEIVPLCGEPLGDEPTTFSSSSISHELGKLVNGDHYNARYIGMVPAFLPDFEEEEIHTIWKLIGLVNHYVEIFGTPESKPGPVPPLAERLDMILTSVGPASEPLGFLKGRLLATGKVTTEELKDLIVGDIGGVCIERAHLSKRPMGRLESVTKRWTGLKFKHLDACAARAAEARAAQQDPLTGMPGVVVVSRGAKRAELVYEAVKRGLVNHLVIDQELAEELEKMSLRVAA